MPGHTAAVSKVHTAARPAVRASDGVEEEDFEVRAVCDAVYEPMFRACARLRHGSDGALREAEHPSAEWQLSSWQLSCEKLVRSCG